jgi:UPF0755 protein
VNSDHPDDRMSSSPGLPGERSDKSRRRLINRILVVGGFVICMAIVAAAVMGAIRLVCDEPTEATETTIAPGTAIVDVSSGLGATQVAKLLKDKGVIESSSAFVDLAKARGSENKLRPGIYSFAQGEKLLTVVEKLEKGAGLPSEKVTIPEGMAIGQTATLLTKSGKIDGKAYGDLARQTDSFTIPRVGESAPKVTTLEGLLFPSTYYLLSDDGPKQLIEAQLNAFAAMTEDLPWDNAKSLGVSPYQIVIIASLIEKEAKVADERSKVAAVIYNRLKKNMPLGVDATVRYAVNKWTGDLTEKDLKIDSPYNTRVKNGLPPAPIASPGIAALKAALGPADVDYLYYVLNDSEGHHFFTASYDEFLRAKQQAPPQ